MFIRRFYTMEVKKFKKIKIELEFQTRQVKF